ncbi:MAG: GNAT family N-acetyltransferase [Anaerolineae bacterium]|nr:GNAT family N-acetyltransferase [Anaerolineae bacterium]
MKIEGLLVDLVPLGERFNALEHRWENGEAAFWGDVGDRQFVSLAVVKRRQEERAARKDQELHSGFGIQAKDGTPIGLFVVGDIKPHLRLGILGVQIGEPQYWGGGYGTDALLLIVDYAFDWLDLRRLWLVTMSLNARVTRQMEKVGFALEARQRRATLADGAWHDLLFYGVQREEWPGREAMIERLGLRAQG